MKSSILLLLTALFCLSITMTSCDKEDPEVIVEPDGTEDIITCNVAHLNISVDENTENDTEIGELIVTVENSTQQPTIVLSDVSPAGAIKLNGNKVIVADQTLFDYETYQQITAKAEATVEGVSGTGDITITIQDVNETSIHVENFVASIDENPENGTEIGELTITIKNTNELANIVLRNVDPAGAITLNGKEVEVADKSLFDYEARQQITAQVEVSAAGLSSTADITINIQDIDDIIEFKDERFKIALVANHQIDTNLDQDISVSEALDFKGNINVSGRQIESLDGIEYFTNVTRIIAFNNNIEEVDFSNNTKITHVYLETNALTSIDVSMLAGLRDFKCHSNNLKSANIANGNNNNIQRMELDGNPDLSCIKVDQVNLLRLSTWRKDPAASYAITCN